MPDDRLTSALSEWRAIEQAATKGPWKVDRSTGGGIRLAPASGAYRQLLAQNFRLAADAEFAATARTAMPLLVAAVEAVLKLHQPHPVKWTNPCGKHWDFAGDYSACTDCEHIAYIACTRCRNTEDEPARFGHCEVRETVRAALTGEKPAR